MPSGSPSSSLPEPAPRDSQARAGSLLDYASPGTVHTPLLERTWRRVRASGPWWVRPSIISIVLVILLIVSKGWLAARPRAWERVSVIASDDRHEMSQSPDGKLVYVDSQRRPRVYDITSGSEVRVEWNENVKVFSWVEASPDGALLAGGASNEVRFWDGRSGALLGQINRAGFAAAGMPGDELLSISGPSADGKRLWTVDNTGVLVAWDVSDKSKPRVLTRRDMGDSFEWIWPRLSPDGRHLMLASQKGGAVVVDAATLADELRIATPAPIGRVQAAFTPDGRGVVIATRSGDENVTGQWHVQVFDLETKQPVASFPFKAAQLRPIEFTPRTHSILLNGDSDMMCAYDPRTGERIWPRRYNICHAPYLFDDEQRLLTHASFADHAHVIDLPTGRVLAKLPAYGSVFRSPDPTRLVLADDKFFTVWHQIAPSEPRVLELRRVWVFPLLAILLAATLMRDGLRRARRAELIVPLPVRLVAIALLLTGSLTLAYSLADVAVKAGVEINTYWCSQPMGNWLMLHALFGLSLAAGGRGWLRATQAFLVLSMTLALFVFVIDPEEWHYEVLDFIWFASRRWLVSIGSAWTLLTAAGMVMLQFSAGRIRNDATRALKPV